MGKESAKFKKIVSGRDLSDQSNKQCVQQLITQAWCNPTLFTSSKDVFEDGHVIIFIRFNGTPITIICRGLRQVGNIYGELLYHLKINGLLEMKDNGIHCFVKQGITWMPVNDINDRFNSGSHIMIIIKPKLKKTIRKF